MVLSPHLDDAVLSAWSVLTGDRPVRVVNVFTGIPAPGPVPRWDRITGATDSAARVEARLAEDLEALALADRQPVGLGFLEQQYRSDPVDESELRAALRRAVSGAFAVYAPAAIRGHEDHVVVRDLAVGLAESPLFLYAEQPYATYFGWPHWVTGDAPDPHRVPEADWDDWLASAPGWPEALYPHVRELTREESDAKLRAMETYRTQFVALNRGPIESLRNETVRRYEVFWEVSPARPAGRSATPREGAGARSRAGR